MVKRVMTKRHGQIILKVIEDDIERRNQDTCMVCIHRKGSECGQLTGDNGKPLKVKTSTPACELIIRDGIPF